VADGDRLPAGLPPQIDPAKVNQALDAAFASPAGMTAAVVVTWRGESSANGTEAGSVRARSSRVGPWQERDRGADGVLIRQGVYDLWQPAPVPEWQTPGDPRAKIKIADLLHMSSGLRIRAPYDPDYDPAGPYPTISTSIREASIPSIMRRRGPCNGLRIPSAGTATPTGARQLSGAARRRAAREDYASFPQRALFDPLGVRSMVIETDPFGNLLTQGYDLACARTGLDWATCTCRTGYGKDDGFCRLDSSSS